MSFAQMLSTQDSNMQMSFVQMLSTQDSNRGIIIYGANATDSGLFKYFNLHPEMQYTGDGNMQVPFFRNVIS